jgi:hypothetical protein
MVSVLIDNSAAPFFAIPLNQNLKHQLVALLARVKEAKSRAVTPNRRAVATSKALELPAAENPRILPWSRWRATANDHATRTRQKEAWTRPTPGGRRGACGSIASSHRHVGHPPSSLPFSLLVSSRWAPRTHARAGAAQPRSCPTPTPTATAAFRWDPSRPSWRASQGPALLHCSSVPCACPRLVELEKEGAPLTVTGHFFL